MEPARNVVPTFSSRTITRTPESGETLASRLSIFNKKIPDNNTLNISKIFEECVAQYTNNIAIRYDAQQLTYLELNEKVNLLANYLRKLGVDQNTVVAIYLDRSIELIISILAIVKAGGAYLPLDIHDPVQRLKVILQDSNPVKILTNNNSYISLSGAIASCEASKVLKVDTFFDERIDIEAENPSHINFPNDLLYVMYTSGSSGAPKGCMISHHSVLNLAKNNNFIQITSTDIIAQVSNTTFDALTFELWGALLNGATLHITHDTELSSLPLFVNFLKSNNISILLLTTYMLNLVVKTCPYAFDNLKYLLFGGERANPEIIKNLLDRKRAYKLSNLKLINAYGPTESTTIATTFQIESEADIKENVPIGKPIGNINCYILNEKMEPVPPGDIGELYLGGDGLALGYLNDIKLASEKFIESPWNKEEKIYKTGDLVYRNAKNIIFVARVDEQIKINGLRIELNEIEAVMVKRRTVKQAIATVELNSEGEKELIAYVIFNEKATNYGEFYQYLKDCLPSHLLPKKLIQVDSISITPNGKVDKKYLCKLKGKNILEAI